MFSLIPCDAYDPQGLMRRYASNKQTKIPNFAIYHHRDTI